MWHQFYWFTYFSISRWLSHRNLWSTWLWPDHSLSPVRPTSQSWSQDSLDRYRRLHCSTSWLNTFHHPNPRPHPIFCPHPPPPHHCFHPPSQAHCYWFHCCHHARRGCERSAEPHGPPMGVCQSPQEDCRRDRVRGARDEPHVVHAVPRLRPHARAVVVQRADTLLRGKEERIRHARSASTEVSVPAANRYRANAVRRRMSKTWPWSPYR